MAGMQPRILCAHCGAELHGGDTVCSSCGAVIEWQKESPVSPVKGTQHSSKSINKKTAAKKFPASFILGIIIGIVVSVVAYEIFLEKRTFFVESGNTQPVAANVQAMQQIQDLENQLQANPNNRAAELELANLFHDNMMWDKAIAHYKSYLMTNPADADARVDLGICYKESNNLPEAKKQMHEALKYEPKHVLANFNLGIVALAEGNLDESNTWFKKTIELAPNSDVGKRAQQLLKQHTQPITLK